MAAELECVSDWQLDRRDDAADVVNRAAEIAIFEPARHDRHRSEILAHVLGLGRQVRDRHHRRRRHELFVRSPYRRGVERVDVEPIVVGISHSHRNRPVEQAKLRRDVAEPGVRQLRRDLLDREAHTRGGHWIDPPVDLGRPFLQPDDIDHAPDLLELAFNLFGQIVQLILVVAENLDLDRIGSALQIAEHVL